MDNRELASVIWLGAVLAACLIHRSSRSSVLAILRTAAHPQILLPLLALAGWVLLLVQVAWGLGLWDVDLLAPTVAWSLASGLVLLFNLEKTWKSEGFLRSTMSKLIGVALFVGFFMNLFPLNLLAELTLQFLAVFLTLLALVAHRDVAHKAVERMAELFLAAIGFALAVFTAIQLARQWDVLDKRLLALELILPVWITVGVLPFVYLLAVYASYQSAFLRVNHAVTTRRERVRAKVAAIAAFRIHLRDLNAFTFFWAKQAGEAKSLRAARQVTNDFRASKRLEEANARGARLRLVRNAGATGTDNAGRQLDQWECDGSEQPSGFPGAHADWGDRPFSLDACANW